MVDTAAKRRKIHKSKEYPVVKSRGYNEKPLDILLFTRPPWLSLSEKGPMSNLELLNLYTEGFF